VLVALGAFVLGLVNAIPAQAARAAVSCGQVITTSITLAADVGPCPADGMIVRADRITVDLAGHTVRGAATRLPSGDAAGIRVAGRSGVTIRGGTVSGFDAGVVVSGGSANTLTHLVVQDNLSSANADPPGSTNFTANLGDGITIVNSAGNTVVQNIVRRNGIYDNISVLGAGSDDNTIQANSITAAVSARLPDFNPVGQGVVIDAAVSSPLNSRVPIHRNKVVGNVIEHNDNSGVYTASNVDGLIDRNTVRFNGFSGNKFNSAINVSADPGLSHLTRVTVSNNNVANNSSVGIDLNAIDAMPTEANQVVRNVVNGNGFLDGDQPKGGGIAFGKDGVVRENQVMNNQGTGVFLGGTNRGNSVIGNTIIGNNHEGIVLAATAGNTVVGNQVHRNTQSGIGVVFSDGPNVVRDNDAAGNMVRPTPYSSFYLPPYTLGADLIELSIAALTEDPPRFDCQPDIWLRNKWGSGGYFPVCVTAGGSGPPNKLASPSPQALAAGPGVAAERPAFQLPKPPSSRPPVVRHVPAR
jgi:parallel beta-helix repeat protein